MRISRSLPNMLVAGSLLLLSWNACGCSTLVLPEAYTGAKSSLESRLALARLHEKHAEPEQAAKIYDALAKQEPDNAQVRHRMAIMAVRTGRMEQALSLFQEALELDADDATIHNDLGYALYLNDQLEQSVEHLLAAVQLKPSLRAAWVNLGLVYGQQQKLEAAVDAFRSAEIPEAALHCNLAYIYAQHGQLEKARDEYLSALRADPGCQIAAEGLLQVSQDIQGSEPITVAVTIAKPNESDAKTSDELDGERSPRDITQLQSPETGIQPFEAE